MSHVHGIQDDWKAYLAWQAELGGEEVVLAAPFVRRAAASAPASIVASAGRPATDEGPRSHPTPSSALYESAPASAAPSYSAAPAIGPDFFSAIAEKLAKPDARGRTKPAASAPAPASASLAAAVPAFDDLEAYWNWLAGEYPKWFPAAAAKGALTRALGHPAPRLAVVELSPSPDGLFAGDSGASLQLLDKMMNAIGLRREDLYLTAVMKTPPPGKAWARKDVARMLPALFRELKLAQCGLVLVLGEACAQAVLRTGSGIPALTGKAAEAEGLSLSATWHPDEIRADGAHHPERPLSREAWTHLQWLRGRLPARGS